MKYFDYTIHKDLKNAKYLHDNGFFVGNRQEIIENEIKYLYEVINSIK